jgi:hypothetical protein
MRTKLATSLCALTASGLLVMATPSGTAEARQRPPLPCLAILGVGTDAAGFCLGTGAIDWHKIARQLSTQSGCALSTWHAGR